MLKRIPKSDISIRPFKAYKEWSFDDTQLEVYEANISSSELSNEFPKNSLYGQLRAQFYSGNEDNPFLRFGDKSNYYDINPNSNDRFLSGSAKVISIPQIYVGETIKKGSVLLTNRGEITIEFKDDLNGNLIRADGDSITFGKIDLENNTIDFVDTTLNPYSGSLQTTLGDFDVNASTFNIIYNSVSYDLKVVSFNMNTGVMIIENIPFLPNESKGVKLGNVFYSQGLIVITRDATSFLNEGWDISFKSTKTIYEHEYLLIASEDDFNVSQNPSAVITEGGEHSLFTDTSGNTHKVYTVQPVKHIRKKSVLENGNVLDYRYTSSVSSSTHFAGFEHWDLSSSVDSTGSFLLPFITTIGLYDDNCDLVAVAKLPQPIKSERDLTVNFIVRFDT